MKHLYKNGEWWAQNDAGKYVKYYNKIEALVQASKSKTRVHYSYFFNTWLNFDKSILGKTPLETLYKERAQQIRDSYDYLVLYYSGGSDSWTVLNTFLKNNIKLDCIFVRWPMKAQPLHRVRSDDKSAYNFMSEWDLVIKKDLEWLAQNHPEIKIEVAEWVDKCSPEYFKDSLFETQQHLHSAANLMRMQTFSENEKKWLSAGKRVAEIWGVDKPIVVADDEGDVGMVFNDGIIAVSTPYHENTEGLELFYWAPNMPELVYEQAYQVFQYFNNNPAMRPLIQRKWDTETKDQAHAAAELAQHAIRTIIYKDWDFSRFQAEKPKSVFREDKDYWLYSHPELKDSIAAWRHNYSSEMDDIDAMYCDLDPLGNKIATKSIFSRFYNIGQFDKTP
jgi:hypothetical protein